MQEGAVGQLARIALGGSSGSPDEQAAAPDEGGGYGPLVEEIDRLLEGVGAEGEPLVVDQKATRATRARLRTAKPRG